MIPSFPLIADCAGIQLPLKRSWDQGATALLTPGADWHLRKLPTGESTGWHLRFGALTAAEAARLTEFHAQVRGAYRCFRFCDPLRNLLAWSEEIARPPWSVPNGVSVTALMNPIEGVLTGAVVVNQSSEECVLSQTVDCSAALPYSFSVSAQGTPGREFALLIENQRRSFGTSQQWRKSVFASAPGGESESVQFGIAIPSGVQLELSGLHAEAGVCQPVYRRSDGLQGVVSNARFSSDELVLIGTEDGTYSAELRIRCGNQ